MKKLKGANRVHPSPPATTRHLSSLLPSAIMSLAAALSPEEQEVLAYLLSASASSAGDRWSHPPHDNRKQRGQKTHRPDLACGCFSCYKSFWARWDSSPNRHVIHLIIDKVEEVEEKLDPFHPRGRNRRRRTGRKKTTTDEDRKEVLQPNCGHVDGDDDDEVDVEAEEESKSSVRRFVSFIGERVWGVWNN